ncbi:C2H2 transcription factor [Lasiodiplodia theobromae]|nr:C2H2 transcription factor [Lasiodiplodia theobromae]
MRVRWPGSRWNHDFHELKPLHVTWRINEQQRASYLDQLSTFSGVLPSTFVLPSRLSISRYVAGFVDGLSHHFPFIHMPTFGITANPDAPELVLALMAVGAQYRYERRSATALYHAARAIISERIRRRELPDPHAASFHERLPRMPPNLLATTRAILLLAKFAAWQASPTLIRESLSYRALLAHSVRRAGLSKSDDDDNNEGQMDDNAWLRWARAETDRRTKLCVFCFLNLQELAFGLEQPVLLANEIGDIRLPSSCREWLAEGQADWLQARTAGPAPVGFRHALTCVLVGPRRDSGEVSEALDDVPVTSPFGNFILVHALLQRIYLARQLALPSTTPSPLRPADVDELDAAFDRWRLEWQRAPESVLDVRHSKDSLAFASTALFGLAHLRRRGGGDRTC